MSDGSTVLPTAGVVSGAVMAVDINTALTALRTAFSGTSAPSINTPAEGQFWLDTSLVGGGGYPILRHYDGANWLPMFVLDTANHAAWPQSGPIATTAGTGAAYTLTTGYEPTGSLKNGFTLQMIIHTANTGACTLAVNGFTAYSLRSASGVDLPAGALLANSTITVTYHSATTEWIIVGFFAGSNPVPPGTISQYAGFSAPSGYLMCSGAAANRVTYANLKTAITIAQTGTLTLNSPSVTGLSDTSQLQYGQPIEGANIPAGTTILAVTSGTALTMSANATAGATETLTFFPWGNGDGSTTFNVPDLRGKPTIGADNMGGTAANISQVTTNLTTTIGLNTATVASATGLFIGMFIVLTSGVPFGTTITAISGTTITMSQNATASVGPLAARFSPYSDANILGKTGGELSHVQQTPEMASHNHTLTDPGHHHNPPNIGNFTFNGSGVQICVTGYVAGQNAGFNTSTSTTGITMATAGSGQPYNNAQPAVITNFIIKT